MAATSNGRQAERSRRFRKEADDGPRSRRLSARELELLELLASGHTSAEIASTLQLSHHTVHTHFRNILRKLEAHSRAQAVAIACTAG